MYRGKFEKKQQLKKKGKDYPGPLEIHLKCLFLFRQLVYWEPSDYSVFHGTAKEKLLVALQDKPAAVYFYSPLTSQDDVELHMLSGRAIAKAEFSLGFLSKCEKEFTRRFVDAAKWSREVKAALLNAKQVLKLYESFKANHPNGLELEQKVYWAASNESRLSKKMPLEQLRDVHYFGGRRKKLLEVILCQRGAINTAEFKSLIPVIKRHSDIGAEFFAGFLEVDKFPQSSLAAILEMEGSLMADVFEECHLQGIEYPLKFIRELPVFFRRIA